MPRTLHVDLALQGGGCKGIALNAALIPDRGVRGAAEAKAITEVLYLGLLVMISLRSFTEDVRPSESDRSPEPVG